MVHGLGFLITHNARIRRLQAVTKTALGRPAPTMQDEPKEEADSWRRSSPPNLLCTEWYGRT